jgi:dihydrolipoamide dehydrogenase
MVMGALRQEAEVVIVGAGPGGYVAAIRAADLGREVVLVDERSQPGGACLLEGCIPSKALIHSVEVASMAREAKRIGLDFGEPKIDLERLRGFVSGVVSGLSSGVQTLLKKRGVETIQGRARFDGPHSVAIEGAATSGIDFRHAIIATGSRARRLALAGELPVWGSAEALALPEVPHRLVVIGGGYIGLELGLVYAGLGSQVALVEFSPRFLPGADPDLVEVMVRSASKRLHRVLVDSRVVGVERSAGGYALRVEHAGAQETLEADQVLAAVGRDPATAGLGLESLGLAPDSRGFLHVDEKGRTAVPGVWAIGDVTPGPMLAHKASREAKVVAEAISGHESAFDNRAIPAVVYTDPEIAWAGLTEQEARTQGRAVRVGAFPLRALGRARTLDRTDGLVKVLADPASSLLLGMGIVGPRASEMISEGVLALELGATLEDLLVTIHPHPTLSEAILEAAEVAAGQAVHVLPALAQGGRT